jgi:hypothetical protein
MSHVFHLSDERYHVLETLAAERGQTPEEGPLPCWMKPGSAHARGMMMKKWSCINRPYSRHGICIPADYPPLARLHAYRQVKVRVSW